MAKWRVNHIAGQNRLGQSNCRSKRVILGGLKQVRINRVTGRVGLAHIFT